MKLSILKEVANYLKNFDFIKRARRVDENIIEFNLTPTKSIYFDMTKGNSNIFLTNPKAIPHEFNAPFDTLLRQYISFAKIEDVELLYPNRILKFKLKPKSEYKNRYIYFQLEFTGRYTNAIILDEDNIILEALHHISKEQSYREIKPQVKLKELKPIKIKEKEIKIDNIEEFLDKSYKDYLNKRLLLLKNQKINKVEKKIKKLKELLKSLPKSEKLLEDSKRYSHIANLLLINLHNIEPYQEIVKLKDFNNEIIEIKMPPLPKNRAPQYYFNLSKKAKQKAKNIILEEKNLKEKLEFFSNLKEALKNSNTIEEVEILMPKRSLQKKKKEKDKNKEIFWIEGYKIFVGRNSKENIEILKMAKSNDIWMHVRDIPGSHVIIRTDKQNIPSKVLEAAAKLCVDFSTKMAGDYKVDYTKRKFVKIQEGSNVEYDKYKTINITKEGVEIRE